MLESLCEIHDDPKIGPNLAYKAESIINTRGVNYFGKRNIHP